MNWFSRKKRDSNLEPMQGQSREEANSGLDEAGDPNPLRS